MRTFIRFGATVLVLSACTSQPTAESPSRAVIATATAEQCDKPSVRIDAVKDLGTGRSITLADSLSDVEVQAGLYSISVACQNPLNETKAQCVFWGHPNEYPTYRMPLKSGVRYTFQCYEVNGELAYRISEKNL
ncbi:MAG: hypothetical protein SXG53_21610 [Pseudomonadota bacterium]|nr:hypothetical protein [Pseudomonadota bacterium]